MTTILQSKSRWKSLTKGEERLVRAHPRYTVSMYTVSLHLLIFQKSFTRPFPLDVAWEIVRHMDTTSLRNFSLANAVCNDLASAFLWRQFSIVGLDASSTLEKFTFLLRLPVRASYVRRLVVGPFMFPWTKELIRLFPEIWQMLPNLQELILDSPYATVNACEFGPRLGGDFTPLLQSLAQHGCHLRLIKFKCATWLRPKSHLHLFLQSQSDLQELIGIDLTPSRLIEADPGFLPCLEVLVCHLVVTAEQLLPDRRIRTLYVYEALKEDRFMTPLASAIRNNPHPLSRCSLLPLPKDIRSSGFATLCSSLNGVTDIDFGAFNFLKMHTLPVFPNLEKLTFRTNGDGVDASRIPDIAESLSPVLRCLRFKFDYIWWVWTRSDLNRCVTGLFWSGLMADGNSKISVWVMEKIVAISLGSQPTIYVLSSRLVSFANTVFEPYRSTK